MKACKKRAGRTNAQRQNIRTNRTITRFSENCKSIRDELMVIIENPYIINDYSTQLLLIDRISFKLGKCGIWYVAGIFFELDSKNFAKASVFFDEVK